MFPIKDSHPTEKTPIVNYLIIGINILAFLIQLTAPDLMGFVFEYGFIPARFSFFHPASYLPILTSIFLHGGIFHIISNMWFLHIFGDNVEDELGHVGYFIFYLLAGVAATMFQYLFAQESQIPMIGASGAVSGVAGAYFVWFNRSKIRTLITAFYIIDVVELPSWIFLGYWFIIQLFSGLGSLVAFDINRGGVAWFAHIGGFLFGYLIANSLVKKPNQPEAYYYS